MKKTICLKAVLVLISLSMLNAVFLKEKAYPLAVGLDKPSMKIVAKPGETKTEVIKVENNGDRESFIQAYKQDWLLNEEGKLEYRPAGALPHSCSDWINISPAQFTISPKGKQEVTVVLSVPEDATGGHYSIIFFESTAGTGTKPDGTSVRIAGRIATVVYQETEGRTNKAGEIAALKISEPDEDKPLRLTYEFENKGNAYIKARGFINILDKDGNLYGKAEEKRGTGTLPGGKFQGDIEWLGTLPEGDYSALLTLDIGEEVSPLLKEAEIKVKKKGSIEKIEVEQSGKDIIPTVTFNNDGNLNIALQGSIEIYKDNALVAARPINQAIVAPKKKMEVDAGAFKNLKSGTHTIKAIITYDGKNITEETEYQIR